MRIALLTLPPTHNYGGILQAVALYNYLKELGHDVTLINKQPYSPLWKKLIVKILENLPFQNIRNKYVEAKKTKQLKPFVKKYLPDRSEVIVTPSDLRRLVAKHRFDMVVVGSDQVWRYEYIKDGYHTVYFLDFKLDFPVKKVAYAASFGKDSWEASEEIDNISELLSDFDAISTRENSGVAICKETFGIPNVKHVADPTMLVGESFYNIFFSEHEKKYNKTQPTLVTYILDKSDKKTQLIDSVKNELEMKGSKYKQINLSEINNGKFYSVEDWLWHIKVADFVITDSFHGMLFSILFKKQFLVIANPERGLSRFESLLEHFKLNERLININKGNPLSMITKKIDYNDLDQEILVRKSERFLMQLL